MPEAAIGVSPDFARCWAQIYAHSDELVFAMDAERRIVAMSDGFAQRFEGADEVLGHRCAVVAHEGGLIPEGCPFRELLLDGKQHAAEVHSEPLGGDFLVRVTPLRDERGDVAYALHSLIDITDRRRAELALEDSEVRFRSYFEQSLVGAAVTSPQKGWIDVNQATCDLLGYSSDELKRFTWADLTHPDDLAADFAQFDRAIAGEIDGYRLEKRFIRKDGAVVSVDLSVHCQRTPEGELDYFLTLLSDVTDRKRLADELDDERQRYKLLVEKSSDAFFLSQPDGAILSANPAACVMFGRSEEELRRIGRAGVMDLTDPRLAEALARRARTGKFVGELRFVRADGTVFPGEISSNVYTDHAGEQRTSMLIRDLTERKAAEEALAASEALYRAMGEAVDYGVWATDAEGKAIYISPSFCELVGKTFEQISAFGWLDVLVPQQREEVERLWLHSVASGEPFEHEHHFVAKGGDIRVVLARGNPVRGRDGEIAAWAGINLDITDRKSVDRALRDSEHRLRRFYEAGLVGVIYWTTDGKIVDANDRFLEMVGYTRAELEAGAIDWIHMTPPEFAYLDERSLEELKGTGVNAAPFEKEYLRKDGTHVPVIVAGAMLDNERRNGVALALDISAQKRAEEALRHLNADLEQRVAARTLQLDAVNKELEAFAYSVSHDLRAPLRAIDGFTEMVIEDAIERLEEDDVQHLQRARAAAQRMASLIDDLLVLSRASSTDLDLEDVDVSALAESVVDELREAEPDRRVDVVVTAGMEVKADPTLLRVILVNLLSNAWKFTGRGDEARIDVGVSEVDGERAFHVRDDGAGFDLHTAEHLFGAFQRFHTLDQFEGNGIGLATVQRLVIRHGGRVWAEAAVDEGATFFFSLHAEKVSA
jgi:PAS domain S-box-containing protein